MKIRLFALFAATVIGLSTMPSMASATGIPTDVENAANCLGQERSQRNSADGDRAHGGFGSIQPDAAQANQPYGQWLQDWILKNCS